MLLGKETVKRFLDQTQKYADENSGCCKVAVGSLIRPKNKKVCIYGANITLPVSCREKGCRRIELYGEDSKNHRLPSDCRSLHSEVTAIAEAARFGLSLEGATIFVTRYPCEACARAIVQAGIICVYYGRQQVIPEEAKAIFDAGNVHVTHVDDWTYEDTER